MASKSRMFELLRSLEYSGAGAVGREAAACWRELTAEQINAMIAAGDAGGRRARIWAAGYSQGYDAAAGDQAGARVWRSEERVAYHAAGNHGPVAPLGVDALAGERPLD
jgi:hypothetical protein